MAYHAPTRFSITGAGLRVAGEPQLEGVGPLLQQPLQVGLGHRAPTVAGDAEGHAVKDDWLPLIGFSANEAVELVEAGVSRPAEVRSGNGDFPGWRLMPFSERCGAVPVVAKCLGKVLGIIRTHP